MELLIPKKNATEILLEIKEEGFEINSWLIEDFRSKVKSGLYKPTVDDRLYELKIRNWIQNSCRKMTGVFPTPVEVDMFLYPPSSTFPGIPVNEIEEKWNQLRWLL